MSLFASLFGNGESDKADKLHQDALDAFGSIATPELSALQVQLNNYVNAGKLTPEEAEAQLLNSNAFNSIKSDPDATGAQKLALGQLQDIGAKGGLTAIDKAQLQDISNQQNQEANSRNQAVMQQAQQRGVGNSDLNTVNALLNEQGAADRASQAGTTVAANAQQRALQALQAAGTLGGQIEAQKYGEQANKATAQNAIDQFNASTQNQFNAGNVQAANQAQAANLANAQNIANQNTATQNANKTYNAQQNQTVYNDQLQKAGAVANLDNSWANSAQDQANKQQAANVGLTSGLVSAGASAINPLAGAFASGAKSGMESAPTGYNPKVAANQYASLGYAEGGEVKPAPSLEDEFNTFVQKYCNGGTVKMANGGSVTIKPGKGMKQSGEVPGKPLVPHNDPMNDTVDAKLSPNEYVVSIDDRKKIENATGDHIGQALKQLMNPTKIAAVRG